MYKFIFIIILLQSCMSIGKLPNDLPQSILIIELLPLNYDDLYDSKTTDKEKKWFAEKASKNKLINEKTINIFSKYPYSVKFVQPNEIVKAYDSTKTNYLLGYGMSKITETQYNNFIITYQIKNIFLQNLLTGTVVKNYRVTTNINAIAPKFVDKAIKLTP